MDRIVGPLASLLHSRRQLVALAEAKGPEMTGALAVSVIAKESSIAVVVIAGTTDEVPEVTYALAVLVIAEESSIDVVVIAETTDDPRHR